MCYFSPDVRIYGNTGRNEYSNPNENGGKSFHMLMLLYEKGIRPHAESGKKFVLFPDNYFTYARTIQAFRELGMGLTGSVGPKRNWLRSKLSETKTALYNDF